MVSSGLQKSPLAVKAINRFPRLPPWIATLNREGAAAGNREYARHGSMQAKPLPPSAA
jgi:hypothetical protein